MKMRYKVALLIIALMLVGCLYVSQSYALWIITKEQTGQNDISTGCFSIRFAEGSSINLQNTYPASDQVGLNQVGYSFTITNTCTINSAYSITLNTLNKNEISDDLIKYAIYEEKSEQKPSVGQTLSVKNTEKGNLTVEGLKESYLLKTGILNGGTKTSDDAPVENGQTKTFHLYLWIKEDATNAIMGKSFEANVTVIHTATSKAASPTAISYIEDLVKINSNDLAYDKEETLNEQEADDTSDSNLRYVGKDPKNYVYFNCDAESEPSKDTCETWRIIGAMNNVEDANGNLASHLKIIRDSIGNYSWDSSETGVNDGYGINEWSTSDIQNVLNNEYLNISGSNLCYKNANNVIETCPTWQNVKIKEEAKAMIANVKWNTKALVEDQNDAEKFNAKAMYETEKKLCQDNEQCDEVSKNSSWIGQVGLMYPSDYGYAVDTTLRDTCLKKSMNSYNSDNCSNNNWLYNGTDEWTITSAPQNESTKNVFYLNSSGNINTANASDAYAIRPVVYLIPSVKITGGSGDINDPFILQA